jgi:hypothetical protein
MSFFGNALNLTDIFGSSWPDIAMDYSASSLIYRICFPAWDGMWIQHDPVYIAYLSNSTAIPEIPTSTILIVIVIITTPLILAVTKTRKRKFAKQP